MAKLKGYLSAKPTIKGSLSKPSSIVGKLAIKTIGSDYPVYSGETVVIPKTIDQQLPTANTVVKADIAVAKIPTYETSNEFGISFIIAS